MERLLDTLGTLSGRFLDTLEPGARRVPRTLMAGEGTSSKLLVSECAKGAAKASCGETVVQKGVFGESVSSLPP